MEDLFQYMKTFRSQVNDVADQAVKMSVEEHMLSTTIETLQKELDLVRNETRKAREETDQMTKDKGDICSQILEKRMKIAYLESDSSTLIQTLKFMQQEKLSLSENLVGKSDHYKKLAEDLNKQFIEHQDNHNSMKSSLQTAEDMVIEQAGEITESQKDTGEILSADFHAAEARFDQIAQLKSNLVLENTKLRQSVELVKTKINNFKPEIREMDEKSLNEELQALLSDKVGETEYVQSLQLQIMKLKEISQRVKCSNCGEEYNVKLDNAFETSPGEETRVC